MKPGPGNGLAMSDEEQSEEEDLSLAELDGRDLGSSGPFGPLVPTDNERSIMERMREELKQELKNVRFSETVVSFSLIFFCFCFAGI